MKKSNKLLIMRTCDFIICSIWCVYTSVRLFFQKSYPPMDRYAILVLTLFFVNEYVVRRKNLYECRNKWIFLVTRNLLICVPLAIGFVLLFII